MAIISPFGARDTTGLEKFTQQKSYHGGPQRRTLILWELPHIGGPDRYLEMYINPQSIRSSQRKSIQSKKTKGGFLMQYWGEELETLGISGSTGDSGIEGLRVMEDIYRSEQLAMSNIVSATPNIEIYRDPNDAVNKTANSTYDTAKSRQGLNVSATSVVMWYQGQGKRGYFTSFDFDENVTSNGVFTYSFNFTVVEVIGRRKNFMAWHRKPVSTMETPSTLDQTNVPTSAGGYEPQYKLGKLNSLSKQKSVQVERDAKGAVVTNKDGSPKIQVTLVNNFSGQRLSQARLTPGNGLGDPVYYSLKNGLPDVLVVGKPTSPPPTNPNTVEKPEATTTPPTPAQGQQAAADATTKATTSPSQTVTVEATPK